MARLMRPSTVLAAHRGCLSLLKCTPAQQCTSEPSSLRGIRCTAQFAWRRILLFAVGPCLACCGPAGQAEPIASAAAALSVCNEIAPSDRSVDGIPAYDQCAASQNSAIYSNNGVDTSTSAKGNDWVRTQWDGGYQCTEFAHRYLHFRWEVEWIPNGNAGTWCNTPPPGSSGMTQTSAPAHGDIIVFLPGVCGSDSRYGHVAVVDEVDTATSEVTIVEQNPAGRRSAAPSCAACFLHAV
ncbi:CHAP domain-containing protein, partial [Myxococcota bacterium]